MNPQPLFKVISAAKNCWMLDDCKVCPYSDEVHCVKHMRNDILVYLQQLYEDSLRGRCIEIDGYFYDIIGIDNNVDRPEDKGKLLAYRGNREVVDIWDNGRVVRHAAINDDDIYVIDPITHEITARLIGWDHRREPYIKEVNHG